MSKAVIRLGFIGICVNLNSLRYLGNGYPVALQQRRKNLRVLPNSFKIVERWHTTLID